MLFHPEQEFFPGLDVPSRQLMQATVDFFEGKGLARIKEDDHERRWYADFLDFVDRQKLFATLLTPPDYAPDNPGAAWDTYRNCALNEILGFYGLAYWYAWQVTILGLGPIWMSPNEKIKRLTGKLLDQGGIFGFGLSEKAHGADLYSSEMMLTPMGDGAYRADGGKYYIGNGNAAALLSTFGKNSETDEYVFFAVRTDHPNYTCVQNLINSQMYVSEYALSGYPISEDEILSTGRDSWDAALNTVNVGKFNLGWASVGICTHAFYEAIDHAARRNLYGRFVTEFPHIQRLFTDAWSRLVAMRLFSLRAIDYMRAASAQDRRYLLYNPLVKMKVTCEGETVINLLWDIIAARGFEKDTYFEMAARDIRALPKLEGTVHVNMALVVKFMANYFFNPGQFDEISPQTAPGHDAFLFNQGPTRGLGKIQFHDYRIAYDRVTVPNAEVFKEQIKVFKKLLATAPPDAAQARDIDFLLSLGELFTLVVYGQLIIEQALADKVEDAVLDQIFDFMVRDFSAHALTLHNHPSSTENQMDLCQQMLRRPRVDKERFQNVWRSHVLACHGRYTMRP